MSQFLDRLKYLTRHNEPFSNKHGETRRESREWEDGYRLRWQHDKVVRSTHGVNCTGSCSWQIYVKNGLVTWETQQTDYPRTRPDMPNHEPRGCPRGASYSWYLYSANRLKYPLVRQELIALWRASLERFPDPVDAWKSIVEDPLLAARYKKARGLGGFVRAEWDELLSLIAASNIYTIKQYGPDRIIGFSPIPAMSMVSYAAGTRYLSMIGGVALSFYDWYCDLPPASPQTWGDQTDVPESADWYNSGYIIAWGSNVPQTRTPDAHFFTEVRYKGTKTVAVTPDYAEVAKLTDEWLSARQGTDAALALAMGHVILKEFHLASGNAYFTDYLKRYSDMPFLVCLEERENGSFQPGRQLRCSDFHDGLGESENADWKPVAWDEQRQCVVVPRGTIGFRWGDSEQRWNLESLDSHGDDIDLQLGFAHHHDEVTSVAFPYFGEGKVDDASAPANGGTLYHNVPTRTITLGNGNKARVATVFDLMCANYGIDRGFESNRADDGAKEVTDMRPYTPAWQEHITGVSAQQCTRIAREFAANAAKTNGRSMIIMGAGINHWYHMDMSYRALINMLILCGCIGKSGGGWSHYVGQEKLRPNTGWSPLAFALDWQRPARQMCGTSFFYIHSSQWRYEKLDVDEILSPLASRERYQGSLVDFNVRAERMGWMPSAPQLNTNPLTLAESARAAGQATPDYVRDQLKEGKLGFASEDPDHPQNFPRVMFVWRSNLLGSSGKGHEYMMKYLLGAHHGINGQHLGETGGSKPEEVKWHENAPEGKLDLLVTLDFRMSTTCLYSDIVLPTATWYEKQDLNTSDMHPFIHPLTAATDPAWESRSDWDIYKGLARRFSELCPGHLGEETDLVTQPLQHDSAAELAQSSVADWKKGECEAIPGITMPSLIEVKRDYPATYERFTAIGPLLEKLGNGNKGLNWQIGPEVEELRQLNHVKLDGPATGQPLLETATNAAEMILNIAPETKGAVAMRAWQSLSEKTGRSHSALAAGRQSDSIRFADIVAQPRKVISSPSWSGIESEKVSYSANYTNIHELIPWRTLTGRQQFYQDHQWMRDFGESLVVYRPPINTRAAEAVKNVPSNGHPAIALNWLTPHQKWGIHSTYSDNLLMQTLSRGGPIVWLSEDDARAIGVEDNDWIEAYNANGALTARAVVSQRVKPGMVMMYHAQERLLNIPGSEVTGGRGGIHNSVTRICPKPTHMIGGYAQLSYSFNYYGTVGSNRDEFVMIRKMNNVNWLDDEQRDSIQEATR